MKNDIIFALLFLNSFFVVFSVVQQWNLENSAVDLFESATYQSIKVIEETNDDGLYVKLFKYIGWDNGVIVYRKYLTVYYSDNEVYNSEENFDKIKSFYPFENDNIICPKGKYHTSFFYNKTYSSLNPSDLPGINDNGDWELKFTTHEQGYFFAFYLMNGQSHFFYKKYGSTIFNNLVAHQEIYGLKLVNLLYNNEYSWAYLVKNGDWIKLKYSNYTIKSDSINRND